MRGVHEDEDHLVRVRISRFRETDVAERDRRWRLGRNPAYPGAVTRSSR
jgi:hypothetical protein